MRPNFLLPYWDDPKDTLAYDWPPPHVEKKPKGCWQRACCPCCPCLPKSLRWSCCTCFSLLLLLLTVVGVMALLFKIPTVHFNGVVDDPTGSPRFVFNETQGPLAFDLHLALRIAIDNQNWQSVFLEGLDALVYHPLSPQPIGNGKVSRLRIGSYTTTKFDFPFQIHYDPHTDTRGILNDIIDRCGFTGYAPQPITVVAHLKPTIKILNTALSITIQRNIQFPCPLQAGVSNYPSS